MFLIWNGTITSVEVATTTAATPVLTAVDRVRHAVGRTVRHPAKLHHPPAYATCSTSGGRLDPLQDGPRTVTDISQQLVHPVDFTPLQTATKYQRGAVGFVDVL
jgi:hypothetical protein